MNNYNEKEEKKGGFGAALSGLFRGGSSVAGSASSGMGSAGGGLAGLFATKAGIVGMVLGGATIAAGVGVIYNFIGPSSKPVYSPELFQNSYYEEESSKAGLERTNSRDASAAASSTLDMFKEQAKKDGLGGLAAEAGDGSNASSEVPAAPADASADSAAAAPGAEGGAAGGSGGGMPKMQASSGFGSKGGGAGGGGSSSSIPRMQSGGGLSGGIGAQFGSVYRPPAQANGGKTSAMTASAARVKSSPKYAIPNVNKKGAYGQAKFAGKMGNKAAFSADASGSRTEATNAFSGETTGAGDVGAPASGAGLGGAGVSNGAGLKGNDPSLNSNESTPPKVPTPEDVDPWQKEEDAAMNGMMWAAGLILVTKLLGKLAKTVPFVYYIAVATALAAIGFALKVVMAGFKMYSEFGQKMMGGIYIVTGLMLAYQAWEALCGLEQGADADTSKSLNDQKGADGKALGNGKPGDTRSITNNGNTTNYTGDGKGGWSSKPMGDMSMGKLF
ncbi:MAG: hypothetical protein PHV36_05140 [Elusimicrobiales bacterium]|nr:hypothetical protein [Elusimicrobiales bacterium]